MTNDRINAYRLSSTVFGQLCAKRAELPNAFCPKPSIQNKKEHAPRYHHGKAGGDIGRRQSTGNDFNWKGKHKPERKIIGDSTHLFRKQIERRNDTAQHHRRGKPDFVQSGR